MRQQPKPLKRILADGGIIHGVGVYSASLAIVELSASAGFDYVLIDLEHSGVGCDLRLETLVRTADSRGLATFVKVEDNEPNAIRKSLEAGAQAVIIPHVQDAEQAAEAVASAKFPPIGRRAAIKNVRSAGYGGCGFDWDAYLAHSNETAMVICMCEDGHHLENAEAIAKTEGVDAVLFGVVDFAVSEGISPTVGLGHPRMRKAFKRLGTAMRAVGKPIMMGFTPLTADRARELIGLGVRALLWQNDLGLLQGALQGVKVEIEALAVR